MIRPAIDVFVALRKESVDRNSTELANIRACILSLSARRAWIEMLSDTSEVEAATGVALRKESVDRNKTLSGLLIGGVKSLSARRAWIEICPPIG